MTVQVVTGNMSTRAKTLINVVKCVGARGKEIALEFKMRFPDMFAGYMKRCNAGEIEHGKPYLFRLSSTPWVLNFPTKRHWREPSRLSDIEAGLTYLAAHYREWGIESRGVPALGCGNGRLRCQEVRPILIQYLGRLDISAEIYLPVNLGTI